jgi:hypothetical protein
MNQMEKLTAPVVMAVTAVTLPGHQVLRKEEAEGNVSAVIDGLGDARLSGVIYFARPWCHDITPTDENTILWKQISLHS